MNRIDIAVDTEKAISSVTIRIPPGARVGGRPYECMVPWAEEQGRIRGHKIPGVYVAGFNTNGEAYPNASDGYIEIVVGASEVSVTATKRQDIGLGAPGNWVNAVLYFHLT